MGSSTGCPLQTSLRGSPDSTQVVFSWPPLFVNTLEQLTELRKAWDLREWVYVKGHRWARWGGGSYMQGLCLLPFLLTKWEAWVSIQNFYWALITWAWLRKPLVTWLNPISSPTPLPNGQGVQGPNPLITEFLFHLPDGQGGLASCNSWGCKESDTTEQLNWTVIPSGKLLKNWLHYLLHVPCCISPVILQFCFSTCPFPYYMVSFFRYGFSHIPFWIVSTKMWAGNKSL